MENDLENKDLQEENGQEPAQEETPKYVRRLMLPGGILWIAGVALTIIGLNVKGDAGTWMTVAGNISFLIGLGVVGALWFIRRRDEERRK